VQRSMRLLPQSPAATRERVAMRLISAEVDRAQWLLRCRRYLTGRVPIVDRTVSTSDLAKEFRSAAPAMALHGGELAVDVPAIQTTVTVDAALLTAAVHGLAWALLALGETAGDPRVRITIDPGAGSHATVVTVNQPTVGLTQPMLLRFFDAGWRGRPGGTAAELAVQLARYAASRQGAELEVSSGAMSGTSITLTLR
jgi:hypothetical protein